MLLQRLVVMLYSLWALLQRIKHKKWYLLVFVSFYMGLRSTQKEPVVGKPRDVFINHMITETKEDGIHMAPTPVVAPWTNASFECVGWKRIHSCKEEKPEDEEKETPEPEKDFLGCSEEIGTQMAGYCIVRNRTSGDLYKLMVSGCDSLPTGYYTCDMARDFSEFGYHSVKYEHNPHDVQGNLVFFHRNSIKLDGKPDQPRIMSHIQEYSLEGNPRDYRIFQAVYAHKECCYYIGTDSLPDGRPATQVTPIDSTIYASIEDLAIQFSVEARQLLIDDALAHDLGFRSMRVQYIVALFLLAYVMAIIAFVWCKGRPARERLPSRWKPMESKES
ncbi:hypothetical protein PC118_g11339 [Phytophthora cactorum]|uniref:Uncharacterized protein n=1 Tax=Phytophthora cactorum TaxID=29920 RepID=A0A8T1FVI0_9STRA|nr:hypothetical protein PC118_g11339 [Phytophthora cactorum]